MIALATPIRRPAVGGASVHAPKEQLRPRDRFRRDPAAREGSRASAFTILVLTDWTTPMATKGSCARAAVTTPPGAGRFGGVTHVGIGWDEPRLAESLKHSIHCQDEGFSSSEQVVRLANHVGTLAHGSVSTLTVEEVDVHVMRNAIPDSERFAY